MNEMDIILDALQKADHKLMEDEIQDSIGLDSETVSNALQRLLLRNLVRCDSYDPSKRGGQAGVRHWGGSAYTALWEAIESDC